MPKVLQQLIILGAFILVIIGLWLFFFFLPYQSKINALKAEIHTLKGDIGREITTKDISYLGDEVDSLSSEFELKRSRIYPVEDLFELGTYFTKIGLERDLKLSEIKPTFGQIRQLLVSNEGIIGLPMTIEYVGPFFGMTHFLDNLEELPFLFKIESFQFIINEVGKSDIRFVLDIRMFFDNQVNVSKEQENSE